ncbi:MAG: ATP-binding protein [Cycloclasticus sp.]|nr:ATP-binding protein [Cycloclasticus sp.]
MVVGKKHILEPHAASLSQSLRDIGYSLESAIADLIDNSITAKANNIWIDFDIHCEHPYLSITDDGKGMSQKMLIEAMRPGAANPRSKRAENDLGRFGLGLKTASFSQCTQLTVITKEDSLLSSAKWDLEIVKNKNKWIVYELSQKDIEKIEPIKKLKNKGTVVIWNNMDRLLEYKAGTISADDFYEKFNSVEKHLSLVFHRFLSGEFRDRKLSVFINGNPIKSFDPFCISNKATQILREEIVRIDGSDIKIQPYILPHHSKLTKVEYDFYKNRSDFLNNQGVYIYRNGRLMAWGDWFRLIPRGEATKLARVKIDFPNALDDLWTIDIKKSRAYPPQQVKERLKNIVNRIGDQSKKVHRQRGAKLFNPEAYPIWDRHTESSSIRYKLNRANPLLLSLLEDLSETNQLAVSKILDVVENAIPVEAIYSDYSTQPRSFDPSSQEGEIDLKAKLKEFWSLMSTTGDWDKVEAFKVISNIKPFCDRRVETEKLIQEILQDD